MGLLGKEVSNRCESGVNTDNWLTELGTGAAPIRMPDPVAVTDGSQTNKKVSLGQHPEHLQGRQTRSSRVHLLHSRTTVYLRATTTSGTKSLRVASHTLYPVQQSLTSQGRLAWENRASRTTTNCSRSEVKGFPTTAEKPRTPKILTDIHHRRNTIHR